MRVVDVPQLSFGPWRQVPPPPTWVMFALLVKSSVFHLIDETALVMRVPGKRKRAGALCGACED